MSIIAGQVTLERGLRAEFENMRATYAPNPVLDKLFMSVNSTNSTEKYGWLGQAPQLVEWNDTRIVKGLTDLSYTLANQAYEATIGVDRFDLVNDNVGSAFARTRELTQRGIEFPQKLLIDAIIAGDTATGLCYDGQQFFDSDHSEGDSGAQDNSNAGTGITSALIKADFQTGQGTMLAFVDSAGEPWRNSSVGLDYVVVCPAALMGVFQELQNAAIISNTTNTIKGLFDLVATGRLDSDDANDWYLFETSLMKPFIKQENQPLQFDALEADSDVGFLSRVYHYGVSWYGKVGYGFWQSALQITNT